MLNNELMRCLIFLTIFLGTFFSNFSQLAIAQAAVNPTPVIENPQALMRENQAVQAQLNQRKAQNIYQYQVDQHNCYSHFFVNYCLNKAHKRMILEKKKIAAAEITLDDQKRLIKAQQRDRATLLRQIKQGQPASSPQEQKKLTAQSPEFAKQVVAAQKAAQKAAVQRAENAKRFQEKQRAKKPAAQ